jgi:hypothetical protein
VFPSFVDSYFSQIVRPVGKGLRSYHGAPMTVFSACGLDSSLQ